MRQGDVEALSELAGSSWDVCIIGSGPAGITAAAELSGNGLRIALLESGGAVRQEFADGLNEVETIGWPRVEDQWLVRNRIVGGASHSWSGRCVPFDAIDYIARPWVPESGWPIRADAFQPYLDRAVRYLGISRGAGYNDEGFWKLAGRPRPLGAFDETVLRSYYWTFSRDPDNAREHMRFGNHLPHWVGDDVTLMTNATVLRINVNETTTLANAIDIAAPDGSRHRLTARFIVVCAGGIENPHLLLASRETLPAGVGNAHDQVGRYLMDHLRGPVTAFSLMGTRRLRRQFGHYRITGGQVFVHGMQMSEMVQRSEALLNCTAWLEGSIAPDDPHNALKRLARMKPDVRGIFLPWRATLACWRAARGARDHFIHRNGLPRKIEHLSLVAMTEQLPDAASRITLSERTDMFGVSRARIDWRVHEQEKRTLRRMTGLVIEEFARLGLPQPIPADWIRDNAALPESFRDVAHPTGTTRMGDDPASSVVDVNCRVHGMKNLYIGGSSVFPTSSHANPTQMIVALTIRLADEIKRASSQTSKILAGVEASI